MKGNDGMKGSHPGGKWKCRCEKCSRFRHDYNASKWLAIKSDDSILVEHRNAQRAWRAAHPDLVSSSNRRRKKESPEAVRARYRRFREKNIDRVRERARKTARQIYWRNPDEARRAAAEWKREKCKSPSAKDAYADRESLRRFRALNPNATEQDCSVYSSALTEHRWLLRARKNYHEVTKLLIERGILAGESDHARKRRKEQNETP